MQNFKLAYLRILMFILSVCTMYKTHAIWNTYEVKLHNLINSTTEDNTYLTFRKPCNWILKWFNLFMFNLKRSEGRNICLWNDIHQGFNIGCPFWDRIQHSIDFLEYFIFMNIYFYCDESRFNKRKTLFIILPLPEHTHIHTHTHTQKKHVLYTHTGTHTFFVNGKELSREKSKIEIWEKLQVW